MILGKYIKKLLEEKQRVILPGFGNLDVKESGTGIPASGKRLDPPGISIKFDSGFSRDDGVLAQAFSEGEEIGEEEAKQQVLELVDAIKFALDKGESYTLTDAGTFSRDDEGKVNFKADPGWVLEPDQYGLEAMDLLELDELPEEETSTTPQDTVTQKPEQISPATPPPFQRESTSTYTPPPRTVVTRNTRPPSGSKPDGRTGTVKRWRIIWIIAGFLIVVLAVLIFIPGNDDTPPPASIPGTEEPATPAEQSTETQSPDPVVSDQQAAQPEAEPAEEEPETVGPEHKFFIIAGSFKHLKNASDLQDQLKAKGYPAEVMITENRMYRVSVASYATKMEAERGLTGIKSEAGLEACWLLSN
jgi:cell division protein FtsN